MNAEIKKTVKKSTAKSKITVKQTRSEIGHPDIQRRTLRALGLGKIGRTVEHNDTPDVRGMLKKVGHLIEIQN